MKKTLRELLCPQPKSKIKAGNGQLKGAYNFYTSSQTQSKFYHSATYNQPALIFGTGGMASVHFCDNPFSTSTDCLVMYGHQGVRLELIYHYLRTNLHILQEGFKGAGLQHISKDYILNIEIDMPEPALQEQITLQMRLIDRLINHKKQQLALLDQLVKSRFIELFGDPEFNTMNWSIAKLSTICDVGSSKRIYQSELKNDGVPFLRISDLNERIDGEVNTPQLFIPMEKFDELKANGLVPVSGDILVTSRGTLGRCYIVKDGDNFYFQDGMISWLSGIDQRILNLFLSHLFSTTGVQKQIMNLQAGSTVAYLSIAMLKQLDIILPPMELQEQFAAFVEQTDKSKLAIQQSLDKLELLKKSLMQEYFG